MPVYLTTQNNVFVIIIFQYHTTLLKQFTNDLFFLVKWVVSSQFFRIINRKEDSDLQLPSLLGNLNRLFQFHHLFMYTWMYEKMMLLTQLSSFPHVLVPDPWCKLATFVVKSRDLFCLCWFLSSSLPIQSALYLFPYINLQAISNL